MNYSSVRDNYAVLLGKGVVADGYWPRRKARVVTHAHSDHTVELHKSVSTQGFIVATPITFAMLDSLGFKIPNSKRRPLNPNECMKIGDETLCFHKAEHIPGSVQVSVENEKGFRVLYTGDFKNPGSGTPIIEDLDVLIIDATYGDPRYKRPSEEEVLESLIDIIDSSLRKDKPVSIYAYNGKIQEIMQLLRIYGIDVPFVAPSKIYWLSKSIERYGYNFGELYSLSQASKEIKDGPHVRFNHFNSFNREKLGGYTKIKLDGWLVGRTYMKIGEREWIVAFSDHADYEGTMRYALESKAKIVIVDAKRSKFGVAFASKLRTRGVHAIPMPTSL